MNAGGEQLPVLFAALNWGMGHASRSVPLIRSLQQKGIAVILASDGDAADLLRAEFPGQTVHELPSYSVRYGSRNIYWNVLRSSWSICTAIRTERKWVKTFLRQQPLRAIISDNRYGIRDSGIPSILVTHQLRFFGPWTWANWIGGWTVRWWARKFTEIWVPDWAGPDRLSGEMARWRYSRPPVKYLGPLSRFDIRAKRSGGPEVDILAILSGPEPQRTHLEGLISTQLGTLPGRHVLIRGTSRERPEELKDPAFACYDLLAAAELQTFISKSAMQISRAGYSTLMDLACSGVPALLIPTPGQIEQEYLAHHLREKGPWLFQDQDELNIREAWNTRNHWVNSHVKQPDRGEAERAITSFLQRLDSGI